MLTDAEIAAMFRNAPQAIEYSTTINATIHVEVREKGPPATLIIGDGIKPVGKALYGDNRSGDLLFVFYARGISRFECVAVPFKDVSQGKATATLRDAGWWCALPTSADKHLNAMYGDVRDILPTLLYVEHQGLQDDDTFLINDAVIGPNPKRYLLPAGRHIADLKKTGTCFGWRQWVSSYTHFPLIVFAISAALSNLPKIALEIPGFCICFVGRTSTGKTTLLRTARSVIGHPDDIEDWNASRPGIEDRLLHLSHTPAFFDEKNSSKDMQNDETLAHLIGNERTRRLTSKIESGHKFQALLLATREHRPNDPRLGKPNQGADARFINVPVGETGHGIFYGADAGADSAVLADALLKDARAHHGWAFAEFSRRLLAERNWRRMCQDAFAKAETAIGGKDLDDLERRARKVFALVGASGYLSAVLDVTPWTPADALDAAAICFDLWRSPPSARTTKAASATAPCDDPIAKILGRLGVGLGGASLDRSEQLARAVLALLAERQWMSRDQRLAIGMRPDPDDPDSEPFIHIKDGEELVCVGDSYLMKHLEENPGRGLQRLKALGSLVVNAGGGLKLSVKVGGDNKAKQFVAVPSRVAALKVEVEGSFNP